MAKKKAKKNKRTKNKSINLTAAQFEVLNAIEDNGGSITNDQLVSAIDVPKNIATVKLNGLKGRGFIKGASTFRFTATGTKAFNNHNSSSSSPSSSRRGSRNNTPNVKFSSKTGTITISGFNQSQIDAMVASAIGGQFQSFIEGLGNVS